MSSDKLKDGGPMVEVELGICCMWQDKSLNSSVNLLSTIVIKVSYEM